MAKGKKQQMDGKVETFVPTTLQQILGDTGFARYRTLDLGEYEAYLNTLSKSDMFAHASRVGIVPTDNRQLLHRKLVSEFKAHTATYRKPKIQTPEQKKPNKEVLDILARGR